MEYASIRDRSRKTLDLVRKDGSSIVEYFKNNKYLYYGLKRGLASLITRINDTKAIRKDELRILLISDNAVLSNIVLLYGLISNQFVYVIPRHKDNWFISNAILSLDIDIIVGNVKNMDTYGVPVISDIDYNSDDSINISRFNINTNQVGGAYVLSPGSFKMEKYYFVSYDTMIESMKRYFYMERNSKPYLPNNFIILGKWEQLFAFYLILPLIYSSNHVHMGRIIFCTDSNIEKMYSIFRTGDCVMQLITSSYEMRKIWDHSLLEINKRKWIFNLNKYSIFKPILRYFLTLKMERFLTKNTKDVHIVNDNFGIEVLDAFKTSKILFTSSYGVLEYANFVAYKNNMLMADSEIGLLSGGIIPKKPQLKYEILEPSTMGEGKLILLTAEDSITNTDDICSVITLPNEEKMLVYHSKDNNLFVNNIFTKLSVDNFVKSFRDSLLIKDLIIYVKKGTVTLLIEPRRNLLDMQYISFEEYNVFIRQLIAEISEKFNIKIDAYAVISFNALRNNVGNLVLDSL